MCIVHIVLNEQEAQGHWQEIESTIAAAEAMGGSRDNTVRDGAPGTKRVQVHSFISRFV